MQLHVEVYKLFLIPEMRSNHLKTGGINSMKIITCEDVILPKNFFPTLYVLYMGINMLFHIHSEALISYQVL